VTKKGGGGKREKACGTEYFFNPSWRDDKKKKKKNGELMFLGGTRGRTLTIRIPVPLWSVYRGVRGGKSRTNLHSPSPTIKSFLCDKRKENVSIFFVLLKDAK